MKHAKTYAMVFGMLSIVLLSVMCACVAYEYRGMLCATQHLLTSAPAWVAFLLAIPFALGIGICLGLYLFFKKKAEKQK